MNKVTFNRNNKKKKEAETKNSLKILKSHYYVYLTTATIHPFPSTYAIIARIYTAGKVVSPINLMPIHPFSSIYPIQGHCY